MTRQDDPHPTRRQVLAVGGTFAAGLGAASVGCLRWPGSDSGTADPAADDRYVPPPESEGGWRVGSPGESWR